MTPRRWPIPRAAQRQDPFIDHLAELCRTHPTRAKWVFVPTHAIGLTLGERLARQGDGWANLRLVTPLDVAVRMAAPFLLERGIDPSEDSLGPALVMRLLLGLPEEDGYFRRMATHASMSAALWRALREMRFAGLRAADLRPEAFESPRKHREIAALASAFERHLEQNHLADAPAVFEQALRHADWCPLQPDDLVIDLPDTLWPPLVRQWLDALPGRRVVPRATAMPGVTTPARAAELMTKAERVDAGADTDAARLRFLQAPSAAGPARADGSLAVFHAGGRDAEIDEVFRRILASGLPLDQVEIACGSGAYVPLAWEKACRLDWPVTLSPGLPATVTRPGRLLLRYCEWLSADVGAAELRRLLQTGDCAPRAFAVETAGPDGHLTPGQAARLLLRAQATWGRDTYAPSLARVAAEYASRAADADASDEGRAWHARKAAQARTLAAWIGGVLAATPSPDAAGQVPVDAMVDAAVAFLDGNAARAGAADTVALGAITGALRELAALGAHRCSLATALSLLTACAETVTVERSRPRPGHLHVSSLADAGVDGRASVFVVGVQEGALLPAAVEDPVLLDVERSRIHPLLRTATDRLDEALHAVLSRLAAIGLGARHVCLSMSCRDTRQFREAFPSWVLLQAFRLQRGDAALGYEQLATALGEPVSAVPAGPPLAPTAAAWWLAACDSNATARDGILRAFPALAAGQRAEAARDSGVFTEFDGHVALAGPLLDPSRTGRLVSATSLEDAAKCPFRFFLREGLGVRPIEEAEAEADAWLTPPGKGGELHALFARIVRFARAQGRRPDLRQDLPRLRAWGDRRLEELRREMPPPSGEVFARERRELLDDLEAFLVAECEGRHGEHPVGVEVGFGLPLDDDHEEPLASAEPLVLDLGRNRRLRLRGRIDRINRLAPGKYEVVDYKTGGFWADDWQGVFAGGTRLQHAIYGRAAEKLLAAKGLRAHVTQGTYVFPAVKGHRRRTAIDAPPAATTDAVLRQLMDVIGAGVFTVPDDRQGCRFCVFADACHAEGPSPPGGDEVTRAAAKLENAANAALDVFRELRRHE